jgi:hypothetical protein
MKATEQQIELAISLLKQASTQDEIRKKTGLNASQINQIEYMNGLEKPWIIRKRIREEEKLKNQIPKFMKNAERDKAIIELALAGSTLQEIASQYGVSGERVRRILIQNNAQTPIEVRKQIKTQNEESDNQKSGLLQNWVKTHMGCTFVELSLGTDIKQKDCVRHLPGDSKHLILKPGEVTNCWITKKWTDNQIFDGIRLAANIKTPLSRVSYDRIRKEHEIDGPSGVRILQRFGFWASACEQAGVQSGKAVRSNYQRTWSELELINWLAVFMRQSPTSSHDAYNQWSKAQVGAPGGQTIRNTLGSWAECCELALLALRKEWTES